MIPTAESRSRTDPQTLEGAGRICGSNLRVVLRTRRPVATMMKKAIRFDQIIPMVMSRFAG